jgi:hypothetical protein
MNKTNQGFEVNLSVVAISAILVASLFVMGGSRFTPDAIAQTNQTGGMMMNETGASMNQTGGMMMNETGASMNQTGGASMNQTGGGGAASQNATVMVPKEAMTTVMGSLQQAMTAVDSGNDDDAKMALMSVQQALTGPAQQAGMSMESMMTSSSSDGGSSSSDGGSSSSDGGSSSGDKSGDSEDSK